MVKVDREGLSGDAVSEPQIGVMNQCVVGVSGIQHAMLPVLGLLLVLVCCILYQRFARNIGHGERAAAAFWALPFAAILIVLAGLCANGLYVSRMRYLGAAVAMVSVGGCLTQLRTLLHGKLASLKGSLSHVIVVARDCILVASSVFVAFMVIELPYNEILASMPLDKALMNLCIIAAAFLALYFVGGRRGALLAVGMLASCAIGLAQYFIALFKSSAIMPSDLLALGTAATVSGGYTYVLGAAQVVCIGLASLAAGLLSFMRPVPVADGPLAARRAKRWLALAREAVGVAIAAGLIIFVMTVNLSDAFGFNRAFWNALVVYREQGFVASFISLAQNSRIEAPEGYTESYAQEVLGAYAARYDEGLGASENRRAAEARFAQEEPSVVVIMNESFADLSIYDGLNAGYPGPEELDEIEGVISKGYVYTSVLGGATCNSEFEFLTGISMGFVGSQNQPYMMYDFSDVSAMPGQFAANGWQTSAIHPNVAFNWNRENVYARMSFDEFYDIESFDADAPVRHAGITDAATYDKVLELLESSDRSQFVFDVTMQNHGGYDAWDLPEDERLDYDVSAIDGMQRGQTSEYISLIAQSEQELTAFLDELEEFDHPVVVVFFGDHQPAMGQTINDAIPGSAEVGTLAHAQRAQQTPYYIWSNYDAAGIGGVPIERDLGLYSLGAYANHLIGAPLTDYQKAQMVIMDDVPVLNAYGYQGVDGQWYSFGDNSPYDGLIRDLEWFQYLVFAEHL